MPQGIPERIWCLESSPVTILGLVNILETTGILAFIVQNSVILSITWLTNEAWFHLSGYVNFFNSGYWANRNPLIKLICTYPHRE
ncbi:hypothetical protein C0J52_10698 [Blattella germanica]|nr:hypothetical protein C0J52_10698 [Blattella germanica]